MGPIHLTPLLHRPLLEASLVDVVPAARFTPHNLLAFTQLIATNRTIPLHRFPMSTLFVRVRSDNIRSMFEYLPQLGREIGGLVRKVLSRSKDSNHNIEEVLAMI